MISSFIHIHIGIGWTGVAFGGMALFLRAPDFLRFLQRLPAFIQAFISFWHTIFGGLYVLCCLFMPITANWIWPRYGTPYEIIILIVAMYLSLGVGFVCIRIYKYLNAKGNGEVRNNEIKAVECHQEIVEIGEESVAHNYMEPDVAQPKYIYIKYLHSILMVFSWVMLLGAGQAFLQNARVNGFPYKQDDQIVDSLVGRCYGRNLISADIPGWLRNLSCEYTSMCRVSSRDEGAENPLFDHSFG